MLSADTRQFLREALAKMRSPVRLVCRGGAPADPGRTEAARLARDLASLAPRITVEEIDLEPDCGAAAAGQLSRAATLAVVGDRDRRLRFAGTPGGHEILALADAILLASSGDSGLSAVSRARLAAVKTPLDILVFVTPT
jgi:alkyl hydroperoxide reductase subunit AhpF